METILNIKENDLYRISINNCDIKIFDKQNFDENTICLKRNEYPTCYDLLDNIIIVGYHDGNIRMTNIDNSLNKIKKVKKVINTPITYILFIPFNKNILISTSYGEIIIYDSKLVNQLTYLQAYTSIDHNIFNDKDINKIQNLSIQNNIYLVSYTNYIIKVHNLENMECIYSLKPNSICSGMGICIKPIQIDSFDNIVCFSFYELSKNNISIAYLNNTYLTNPSQHINNYINSFIKKKNSTIQSDNKSFFENNNVQNNNGNITIKINFNNFVENDNNIIIDKYSTYDNMCNVLNIKNITGSIQNIYVTNDYIYILSASLMQDFIYILSTNDCTYIHKILLQLFCKIKNIKIFNDFHKRIHVYTHLSPNNLIKYSLNNKSIYRYYTMVFKFFTDNYISEKNISYYMYQIFTCDDLSQYILSYLV
jgi:hypothetical protein